MPVVDLRQLFGLDSLEKGGMNSFIAVQVPGGDRGQLARPVGGRVIGHGAYIAEAA